MAPMPVNKNPNMKRQTGTVPKTTSTSSSATATNATNKSSSRKNTEIVAPTRRELNDLNDYLLSVAESTKQQNNVDHSHLDTSCFELENLNFQENQRFCWPVRPIPRRNVLKANSDNQNQLAATYLGNCATTNPVSNTAAAIGVVIPTTPSSQIIEDSINSSRIASSNHHQSHNHHHHHHNLNQSHHHNNHSRHQNQNQTHSNSIAEELNGHPSNINLDSDLTWEQRLNFIQYFLSLTSKSAPNKDSFENQNLNVKMVNEIKEGEVYNSTSLEDVAHSEASDAHSVTSVHTISSPNTPTYEELQSKLEASSRNMQNIKDQQQQLLKLQQAAKQHLSDMENFRNQHKPAHFNQNGSAPPDYESVEEVQSDMSNLVNRMKALTTFIQGQHELSGLLGEDGPEILAEQQALHEKLQELRSKKLEMQNLVSELQEINNSAEASVQRQNAEDIEARVVPVEYERVVPIELVGNSTQQKIGPQVNGHYSHCNGSGSHDIEESAVEDPAKQTAEDDEAAVAIANDLIQQKMSDINAMKNQLKRLKDMMETVKQIETKAEGKSAKEIADEAVSEPERLSSTDPENRENCSKTSNSTAIPFAAEEKDASITQEEEEMSERVRVLHEMTQDLRNQAVHLAVERDRLKAIKDDLTRRRDVENSAIQNKNLNREASGTSLNSSANKEAEKLRLKVEYEAKKKEFEKLCQRLESDDLIRNDDEEEDELTEIEATERDVKKEPATIYYPQDTWRSNPNASASSSVRGGKQSSIAQLACRGKESTDSGAVDVNGIASLEDNSFQSGSTRSFSMPPPMRTLSTRDTPWRKNSQDNSQSQFDHYAPPPPPLPVWNPNYYYSTPYAQQFSPHCHHHMMLPAGSHLSGEYFCTPHQSHSSAVSGATGSNVATAVPPPPPTLHSQAIHVQPSAGITSNDPVLLQQFIQTQQMLINSVCQCNQLLWHQQREINNLNNAVLLLQERLLNQVGNSMPEIPSLNNRAESVPPTSVTVANGIYTSAAQRAQSEQPHPQAMLPPHPIHPAYQIMQTPMSSPMRQYQAHNFSNVCHQQQHQQRRNISNAQGQSQQAISSNAAYNYTSAGQEAVFANNTCSQQQQQHISSSSTYNNASSHQTTTGFLNNDVSHSIPLQHPAPPIFMHHHNNTITPGPASGPNNHSNLLNSQQNCLNSPSAGETGGIYQNAGANPAAAPAPNTSNAAAAAAALNNQVPPGNRANNYWDNFRR